MYVGTYYGVNKHHMGTFFFLLSRSSLVAELDPCRAGRVAWQGRIG